MKKKKEKESVFLDIVLLKIKFTGAMAVSVHWDTLFIIENSSLDWWKAPGMERYAVFPLVAHIPLLSLNQVIQSFLHLCKQVATICTSQLQYLYIYCLEVHFHVPRTCLQTATENLPFMPHCSVCLTLQ